MLSMGIGSETLKLHAASLRGITNNITSADVNDITIGWSIHVFLKMNNGTSV